MNNLEQVSSDHHQISLAGGVRPRFDVKGGDRSLGLMLGHLISDLSHDRMTDGQTPVKALPFRNFIGAVKTYNHTYKSLVFE